MGPIVDFLAGRGGDARGRTLDQILTWDDAELERRHDFIQWLFPLTEPSAAVPGSPVLSQAQVQAIRADPAARRNLDRSAARMLAFYAATTHWRGPADHNHLRITRIIRSLRLLAGDQAADAFRQVILHLAEHTPVSDVTRAYWARA